MSDEKKIEMLFAHYSDVVDELRSNIRLRYRYLFYILLIAVIVTMEMFFPEDIQPIIESMLVNILKMSSPLDFSIVETGLFFGLLLLIVRYMQIVVGVERQHQYTHWLEDRINELIKNDLIIYQGKFYNLQNYPAVLSTIDWLYKKFIPFLFIWIAASRGLFAVWQVMLAVSAFIDKGSDLGNIVIWIFNLIFAIIISVSVIRYLKFEASGC